jgi:hypothetical protein
MKIVVLLLATSCFALLVDPYDTTKIQYEGRFAFPTDEKNVVFDWSGVSFSIRFTNTKSLPTVLLQDCLNLYNVYISADNISTRTSILNTTKDDAVKKYDLGHTIALDPTKVYTLQIEKRTEALFGAVRFSGFEFEDSTQVLPVVPKTGLKMVFVGDSITCGYGNEGTSPCHFSRDTE